MKKPFYLNSLAIVGLGLMGGSLGLAVKKKRLAGKVCGFARRLQSRRLALKLGVVDEAYARLDSAVSDADLVVFCTSVSSIVELAGACAESFSKSCVVTDVGSSKREIVAKLDPIFKKGNASFVGSHPIAGSEKKGLAAARHDLYEKAVVVLTPTKRTDPRALDQVRGFWRALGAKAIITSPAEHDNLMAMTSHLPHLVAAMLARHSGRRDAGNTRDFHGPGFFDTTRIAEGDPDLWMEIIMSNASAIARELRAFEREAGYVRKIVESANYSALRRFLADARESRQKLLS